MNVKNKIVWNETNKEILQYNLKYNVMKQSNNLISYYYSYFKQRISSNKLIELKEIFEINKNFDYLKEFSNNQAFYRFQEILKQYNII